MNDEDLCRALLAAAGETANAECWQRPGEDVYTLNMRLAMADPTLDCPFATDWFAAFRAREEADIQIAEATMLGTDSGTIGCQRCKSQRVSVRTMQIRSADEGATEIRTCLDCGLVRTSG